MQGQSSSTNFFTGNFDFNNWLNSNNPELIPHNVAPVNAPDHGGSTSMGSMGSSSAVSSQCEVSLGDSNLERGGHAGIGQMLEGWNSGLITNSSSALHASSSVSVPQIDLNVAYQGNDGNIGQGSRALGHAVEEINQISGSSGGLCACHKRKAPEQASGPHPFYGNSNSSRQVVIRDSNIIPTRSESAGDSYVCTLSDNLLNPNQSDQVTTGLGLGFVMEESESYMNGNSSVVGTTESFHRNIRARTTEIHQNLFPPSISFPGNSVINSHVQFPGQTSIISSMNHYNNFPGNIASTSRSGSTVGFLPSAPAGFAQFAHPNRSSAGVQLFSGGPGFPPRNTANGYVQRLSEIVDQSRTILASSNNGVPIVNQPQLSRPSITRQDVIASRAGDLRALENILMQGVLMTRAPMHNADFPPIPPEWRPIVAAQRRARMFSAIRRALGLQQRSEATQDEDAPIIDTSQFYGEPEEEEDDEELEEYDWFENMRLDVDDMSYEELLALGERIGNVSTGLSQEAILACMRRHTFESIKRGPEVDAKSCCICLDDYANGQELGKLDCGHDFHFDCIKQWLMEKNSCPICKKTAMVNQK
ncbi:unnamed protein product [Ilex paraguariensis]|uniref:RING-type E3 ubiquitin transferase n=1 Tax=Ilex paraguariensis TaxID=185542 RepID=A0ABC8SQH6_9AQUA